MKNWFKKKIKTDNKTLRDEFAMSALQEIIREQGQLKYGYGGCENILRNNCDLAYKIADVMINARK